MSSDCLPTRHWRLASKGGLAVCVLLAWATPFPARAAEPVKASQPYQVQPGDTLRKIALRFYGSKAYWTMIYQANRGAIGRNPDLILEGAVLQLPQGPHMGRVSTLKPASSLPTPPRLPRPTATPKPPSLPVLPPSALLPEPLPSPEPSPEPSPLPTLEPVAVAPISLPAAPSRISPYWPAAASLILPGSAQLARGDWDRGISHLGLSALSLGAYQVGVRSADPSLQWTGGLGLVGISLWSAWDAYQRAADVTNP